MIVDQRVHPGEVLVKTDVKCRIPGLCWHGLLPNHDGLLLVVHGHHRLTRIRIFEADALVAASTGPLHIAAALGKRAIGIYPPIKPMHPGRWAPVGENADYLVLNKVCADCRKEKKCHCMEEIKPKVILQKMEEYFEK